MDIHMLLRICFIIGYVTALSLPENIGDEIASDIPDVNDHLFNKLIERVERLESRDKIQQNEIDSLRAELQVEKQRRKWLEKSIRKRTNGVKKSKQKYVLSPTETDASSGEISEPPSDDSYIVRNSKNTNRIRRAGNEMSVAFFSSLTDHLLHEGVKQTVVFDHVLTNIGNAYNNHAGVFIAPVQGTYVFSVTLMTLSNDSGANYRFVKNGYLFSKIYVRGGTESPHTTSSQTVVLEMNQGDDMLIQNIDADKSLHGLHFSTFAGFLLQQDYSSPSIVGK